MRGLIRKVSRSGLTVLAAYPAICLSAAVIRADESAGHRTPQWPLKTSRVLYTDQQIARARQLCEQDEAARNLRERIIKEAEYWAGQSDEYLHALLPDRHVPRAFEVSTEGCPVHGKAIYRHGFYPWKLDRERPFTIICPIGGERYPSNDFGAYYRTGLRDESLLTGPYADAGRGWVGPDGEKYWLVAYACHWNWMDTWFPAVTALSQAYVLTGDQVYARKAIVMLDRIAEVYPGMEYCTQSRYGELMQGKYHGKIVNAIWETEALRRLAIAYDLVFDALIGERPIGLAWRPAEAIRANIEANLLEEGIDGIARDRVAGNYGMHQNALTHAVLVRQNGPTDKLVRGIFETTGRGLRHEGLNYALYNLVHKDGMPYESSPNYAAMWLRHFVEMAGPLGRAGFDVYAEPRMKRMYDAPLGLICAGGFTPTVGDSGDIYSGWIFPGPEVYEAVYRRYKDPAYAWVLGKLGALGDEEYDTFEKLFEEPISVAAKADAERYQPRPTSRLLDGWGAAILNHPRDSVAVSMFYGVRSLHAHRDCLNIELFGHGRRLSPDLGYPDQTDNFHSGIFSWTQNTVSHNCLVVDRRVQESAEAGKVLRFHESPTVHVVDVDAAGTYQKTDVYRRTLVLVDTDEQNAYLVDVFRVRGGSDHVLSIHGAEGAFYLDGVSLPLPVTEGTLAGGEVSYGELYDDPVLSKPGYSGGYKGYQGSGYSHFFNWQKVEPDRPVTGRWQLSGKPAAELRVHIPPFAGQELIVADAYVSPTKKIPAVLKYMLVRRAGGKEGNCFVTVWEPAAADNRIEGIEIAQDPADAGCESTVTLTVHRGAATDIVLLAADPGVMRDAGSGVRTDAAVAVCTREGDLWTRRFAAGGSVLDCADQEVIRIPATLSGRVVEVDYDAGTVMIETNAGGDIEGETGRVARFFNSAHSSIHRLTLDRSVEQRRRAVIRDGEILTGRMCVSSVDANQGCLKTSSYSPFATSLIGMHVAGPELQPIGRIASFGRGTIGLEGGHVGRVLNELANGAGDVWITDFGPGDNVEIESAVHVGPGP